MNLLQYMAKTTRNIEWPPHAKYVALSMGGANEEYGVLQFFEERPSPTWTEVTLSFRNSYKKKYWTNGGLMLNHYEYVTYHKDACLRAFTKEELDAVVIEETPEPEVEKDGIWPYIGLCLCMIAIVYLVLNGGLR